MDTALYLLPVTLGDTPIESVLPSYNTLIPQHYNLTLFISF